MSQPQHLAASIRQRLLNYAQAQGEDFHLVLTRYAIERLLYRLEQSDVADRFILKGAMLFILWSNEPHRATKDLDFCWVPNRFEFDRERVHQYIARCTRARTRRDASNAPVSLSSAKSKLVEPLTRQGIQ